YELNTTANTIKVYGLTSFSTFAVTDNDNPLPVELSSFTSSIDRRKVTLNWSTATEQNNSGFDIERKSTGAENSWSKVGNVAGAGNSNATVSYNFVDNNVNTGKYNYRLKQIDFNGNFKYYDLSSEVIVGVPSKFEISQNYPNPFNPSTKINFDLPFDSKVQIKIFDITGKEMAQIVNESRTAGYYTVQFNASSLSSGIYFYQINATGGSQSFVKTMKMVLVK
ncbi:MAG: T9SS type A sorting domain-containing protein, partial [Ignavibacteria bacterium]|nr:T9SS type A sorting domain-containing protein [Ignavibacteria bacterium]